MKVWLSTIGMSPFAVINTLWAACKEENFCPERIYLIKNKDVEKHVDTVKDWIGRILKEYNIEKPEINLVDADETDFKNFASKLGNVVKIEKSAGNEIAIDMTPGRKFMSAFAMYIAVASEVHFKADRIYYLHLLDLSYVNKSYLEIPMTKQKLYEMKSTLRG